MNSDSRQNPLLPLAPPSPNRLVTRRRLHAPTLSWPWRDHLLGDRNRLRHHPLRLSLPPRTLPLIHRQEKRPAHQEDHTVLLRWSLRDERGAEGSGAGSSHGRGRPPHELSDRNCPRRLLVSYGLSKRTGADHCNALLRGAPQRSTRRLQPNPRLPLGWRQSPPRKPLEPIEEPPQRNRERDPS